MRTEVVALSMTIEGDDSRFKALVSFFRQHARVGEMRLADGAFNFGNTHLDLMITRLRCIKCALLLLLLP